MSSHKPIPNEADKVASGALATTIGLVAFATLAIALVVTALVREEVSRISVDRIGTQANVYRDLKAGQESSLKSDPTWLDQAKGVVSLPIDAAMDWVVNAVSKNPYALSPGAVPPEGMGGAMGDEPEPDTEQADQADAAEDGTTAEAAQPTASSDAKPAHSAEPATAQQGDATKAAPAATSAVEVPAPASSAAPVAPVTPEN